MGRKKAAAAEAPTDTISTDGQDTSFNYGALDQPTQADNAATAQAVVNQVAESTRIDQDEKPKSHAEAVGRKPGYSPAGKTDAVAGVRLGEYQNPEAKLYLSIIRFDEKPSEAVRGMMHQAGFKWSGENKEWTKKVNYETRQQDRLNAERTFEEVAKAVREEKGITHSYG